ncbi:MAG: hypothetical protein HC841_08865 [Verrucomicrobiae bacterium]|nr:hypothetical protein [Verrucomicrobiae bacterium]
MKSVLLIAGLSLLGAGAALAQAKPTAKFPIAADGTTNVADCVKAPAEARDDCISRARPMTGKALAEFTKAQTAAEAAKAAKVKTAVASAKPANEASAKADKPSAEDKAKRRAAEKAAKRAQIRYNKARVASAPKGLKVASDGSTDINQCASVGPKLFDACISRARPLNAKALAEFTARRTAAAAKLAAASAKPAKSAKVAVKSEPKKVETKTVEAKAVPAAKPILDVKGFVVAKDGTTNVADCAKAKPEFKNECISRARPLTGAEIYGKTAKPGKGG